MSDCTMQLSKRTMLSTPDRLLVATDLSDLDWLVPHAIAQAKAYNAPITFVHAISSVYAASLELVERTGEDPARLVKEVRRALADIVTRVESEGIVCSTAVRVGTPSEVIREQLLMPGSARIIMGTHGRGKLRQLALGSVAHALIAQGDVSIFIVGPQAHNSSKNPSPRHILHPVSFIGDYKDGARLAFDLAARYNADVTLVHVLGPEAQKDIYPTRVIDWAKDALLQLIPDAQQFAGTTRVEVVFGKVAEQILAGADKSAADWIVLATDEGTNTGVFNESRAFEVLASARCPVFTFRF
ncbi:MAG: universal stress protein [Acidobacteriota bacterium]